MPFFSPMPWEINVLVLSRHRSLRASDFCSRKVPGLCPHFFDVAGGGGTASSWLRGPVTEQKTLMLATLWKKFRSGLSGSQSWYEAEADSIPGSSQSSPPSFLLLLCENHVTLSDLGACLREQTYLSFPKRILHFYNL